MTPDSAHCIVDLDGHHWLFARHARDVSPDEWGAKIAPGSRPLSALTWVSENDASNHSTFDLEAGGPPFAEQYISKDFSELHTGVPRSLRPLQGAGDGTDHTAGGRTRIFMIAVSLTRTGPTSPYM